MNGDVARLIMDKPTTSKLGGIVTIDHYVDSPQQLVRDAQQIASQSGGKIVLGEFGAPIPDIHGQMHEIDQGEWIDQAFQSIIQTPEIIGMNYWTSYGGSTALWKEDHTPFKAVEIINKYYLPPILSGRVLDLQQQPIVGAEVRLSNTRYTFTNNQGYFTLANFSQPTILTVSAHNYQSVSYPVESMNQESITIFLPFEAHSYQRFSFIQWFQHLLRSLRR